MLFLVIFSGVKNMLNFENFERGCSNLTKDIDGSGTKTISGGRIGGNRILKETGFMGIAITLQFPGLIKSSGGWPVPGKDPGRLKESHGVRQSMYMGIANRCG